jgi:Ca2+-binding EF-hand superfamily protein
MASELQQRKWPNLFRAFDANGDGALSEDDVEAFADRIARMRGLEAGSSEERELKGGFQGFWKTIEPADTNNDGRVEPEEWIGFWSRLAASRETYHQVVTPISETIFGLLDQDGDGQITYEEFQRLYGAIGVGEEHAREMFGRLGRSPDDTITPEEATELTDQYFVGDDPDAPGNWFFGPI